MPRGRKPVPEAILKIRGSRIRGPHRNSIQAEPGMPPAPPWLCDLARSEWERIVPMLESSKVMSLRHQQTLAAYCDSYADMVQADAELREQGATVTDERGRVSNHPAWMRKKDARLSMLRFAAEFGLTASALARVNAIEAPKESTGDDDRMFA